MKLFEIEYSEDLKEINNRLEKETDEIQIRRLLDDRQSIINYLNNLSSFEYNNVFDKEMIFNDIHSYRFYSKDIKDMIIFYNNPKLLSLFNIFIQEDEFKIRKIFEYIKSYNGIKLTNKKNSFYYGYTSFLASLDKNYINIYKNRKDFVNASTLIHELGHAIINSFSLKKEKININNFLNEVYPIFLELMFADYLKENGLLKESYCLKKELLKQIQKNYVELRGELNSYMKYNEKRIFDKFCFESKYLALKGSLIALEFYFNYKSNKEYTLETIDKFIRNVKSVDNNYLLRLLNINNSNANFNIDSFSLLIKEEYQKIKQK